MLRALRILLVLSVALALVGLPAFPQLTIGPMTVAQVRVPLAFAADGDEQWVSEELQGEPTIAGLTWDDVADAPERAEVRVKVDGVWSRWEALAIDDEHGPDPGSNEDGAARGGTSPIVIEGAEAVQFRVVDDRPPTDLTADLVDVDDPDGSDRVRRPVGTADAAATEPAIHTRADWGGQDCRAGDGPYYTDEVRTLFVHHTTGHTTYTEADVPGIVRAICAYHVNGRGWSDIGYNALVDRFGGIWEGRAGGLERGVIGAHTGGFNSLSTGVALIGDHESGGAPTDAALEGLARYAAWKLGVHGVDPTATLTLLSRGSSRWAAGHAVEMATISGHRDASYTSCPGRHCYARLDPLRARVQELTGFATYGGWPQATEFGPRDDGTRGWVPAEFGLYFDEEADWSLVVRNEGGGAVHRASGRGLVAIPTWDGTVDGRPARPGEYTVHIAATRVRDGERARDLTHAFRLGSPVGEFDDVPWDNIFREDVRWLAEQGITTGCDATHTLFCPKDAVLRGQMAAFLNRALQLPAGVEEVFTDVPTTHLFSRDVAAFAAAGITTGCADGTRFCPERPVSRQAMAAFLVRALDLPPGTGRRFEDVPADSLFVDEIDRLAAAGITTGCSKDGTRFCPGSPVTREQMAAFLHRALTRDPGSTP